MFSTDPQQAGGFLVMPNAVQSSRYGDIPSAVMYLEHSSFQIFSQPLLLLSGTPEGLLEAPSDQEES